jgi:hypothetical protein
MTAELTADEVHEVIQKTHIQKVDGIPMDELMELAKAHTAYNISDMMPRRPPAFYQKLTGQKFTLRFDNRGPEIAYEFKDLHTLVWNDGNGPHEDYYEAFEIDRDIVLLAYMLKGTKPQEAATIVLDLGMNLTTGIFGVMGNGYSTREVGQYIVFGVIDRGDGREPLLWRHHFTRDLVGKSMGWAYRDDMSSQHIYATPNSYSWTILSMGGDGFTHSSMAKYIKVNDHVYILTWVEERAAGVQGITLMNLQTMHDVGTFFGINHEQEFNFVVFGGRAYSLGTLNNKELFRW